jgi:hypothetical protein
MHFINDYMSPAEYEKVEAEEVFFVWKSVGTSTALSSGFLTDLS